MTSPPAPLAGIAIVEALSAACPLALRLSASLAGRIAADLGARVVMLEAEGESPLRKTGPFLQDGSSALFAFLAAGKLSATDQPSVAAPLLSRADAVIADTQRRDLPQSGPVQVLLSMLAPAVQASAAAAAPHSAFTIMALGGMLDIVGDPRRPPLRLGGHQLAYAGGLAAYAGLVSALLRRPAPETARVSLLDVAVWLNWKSVASVACMGAVLSRPGRTAEWPMLRCADGYVALVYQPPDWPALCRLCGDERLNETRFAEPAGRRTHALALADIIESAVGHLTRHELQERALSLRLPLGPVWDTAELKRDPQLVARNFLLAMGGIPRLPVLWNGAAFPVGAVPA